MQKANDMLATGFTFGMQNALTESQNCEWNDVIFVIGKEEKTFHGIKALFAIHSPVFKLGVSRYIINSKLKNIAK